MLALFAPYTRDLGLEGRYTEGPCDYSLSKQSMGPALVTCAGQNNVANAGQATQRQRVCAQRDRQAHDLAVAARYQRRAGRCRQSPARRPCRSRSPTRSSARPPAPRLRAQGRARKGASRAWSEYATLASKISGCLLVSCTPATCALIRSAFCSACVKYSCSKHILWQVLLAVTIPGISEVR